MTCPRSWGTSRAGGSIADKVGLSGTSLGVGLAFIRLASLASLPLIGIADRFGRRRMILLVTIAGLALTVIAAGSPGYWWFVVIFAFGRPLLSATNALAEVMAAEETASTDRAAAVALIAAGYGVGAGSPPSSTASRPERSGSGASSRLAVVPLVVVFALRGWWRNRPGSWWPRRRRTTRRRSSEPSGPRFRKRLVVLALVTFAVSVITGPANSFIFLYAQDVLHQRGWVTALMVASAGVTGLLGSLTGRWLADHVGRRPTCTAAMVAVAASGPLAYSGTRPALIVGYTLGVFSGSLLAPAAGALLSELFPTSVRASATGWCVAAGVLGAVVGLVAFGAVADVGNRFASAADLTFLPTVVAAVLFWLVPETMGREPEALWPSDA